MAWKRISKAEAKRRAAAFVAGLTMKWGAETVPHGKRRKGKRKLNHGTKHV